MRRRFRIITGSVLVCATSLASVTLLGAPASAATYLCSETGCPAAESWISARGYPGNWKSYWNQSPGHNCTNYVAWRLIQNGTPRFMTRGNANTWAVTAAQAGILVDRTPTVGSIAQWESGRDGMSAAGHVAYVQKVEGDRVTISEDAWNDGSQLGPFRWRTISASQPSYYIHFAGARTSDWSQSLSVGERAGALDSSGTFITRDGVVDVDPSGDRGERHRHEW